MIDPLEAYRTHLLAAGRPHTTVRLRIWQLRRVVEEVGPLLRASTADLAGYLAAQDWAPATRYSVRVTLLDFYRLMVSSGRLRHSPAEGLPTVRVHRRALPACPEAALEHVEGDERVRLMVDLAAREGLRRGEVAGIHTRDLVRDVDGWSLRVRGKGDRDRMVPLHPDIAARLRARGPGWVFDSPAGGHLTAGRVGELIAAALPQGWTAHSLRRRFAAQAYRGSHDLRAVQLLLGHSSLATTQVYLGEDGGRLRDAVRAAA